MQKALLSKADLERLALQEIRSFPGTELVISIEVECGPQEFGANWTLHVIAQDGCDLDRIHHAADTASHRLKQRYDLRVDV